MFLAGLALFKFPLQHHMILARFQHYGLCLYVWSLGFFFQTIWSWRYLTGIGRASLLSTGTYLAIFGFIFYESPWLDSRMAVQTEEQDLLRLAYAAAGALFGSIIVILWLVWMLERKHYGDKGGPVAKTVEPEIQQEPGI